MAEKYGVVPPKFSKEWWPYFWEYYKIHTFAAAFILIAVVTTAVQCATREKFDLTMTFAGNMVFSEEQSDAIEATCEQYIEDIDGNGENNIFFQVLSISGEQSNAEYDMALKTKLMLEFQNENSYIYLLDKEQLEALFDEDAMIDTFVPAQDWADNFDDTENITGKDGKVYGIDISNCKIFTDAGVSAKKPIYAFIKDCMKDEEKPAYESSVNILKELVKSN